MEVGIAELTRQGRYTEAAELCRRQFEMSRSILGPKDTSTLSTMYHLGAINHVAGKFEEAEKIFRQLLPLREEKLGPDKPDTIAVLDAIAETLSSMRKYKEAMKMLDDKLRRCEREFSAEHRLTITTLHNMGQLYMMQGDSHLVISVLLRAPELSERLFGPEHSSTKRIQDDLTKIRGPQDSLALRQMLALKHGLPIPSDPLTGITSMNWSQLRRRYKGMMGLTSCGSEVINGLSLRDAEIMGHDPNPPFHMPSAYSDEDERYDDDEGPGMYLGTNERLVQNNIDHFVNVVVASSQIFRSLVERSIKAWKRLNQKGLAQAIKKHSQVLRGFKSLDDFLNFKDHQYWFFQLRDAFLRQNSFQKWNPDCLDDYIVLPVESTFANDTDCIFLSHYWRGRGNPDPEGLDLKPLQQRLLNGFWGRASYFWVDFTCLPQWSRESPRTPPQDTYFRRVLLSIPKLTRDCGFI
jgi:tetratricopeptide (TPR) repeat protein